MKKIIWLIIVIIVVLCACKRPIRYSDIPEIKFISFKKNPEYKILSSGDTLFIDGGELTFYFQDGDGDIGLARWETEPPFDFNFFCDYYEKQQGTFVKIDSIETLNEGMQPFNLNARIPKLSDLPEESINGEICIIMPLYYAPFSLYNDTIQLKFYIVDKKLNRSNTEEVIIIRQLMTNEL